MVRKQRIVFSLAGTPYIISLAFLLLSSAFLPCNEAVAGTYTTSFRLTENPVSEGGNWINGKTVGLDWTNARTTPGLAFGTQTGSNGYDDSIAVLAGTWLPNQQARAVVHSVNQDGGSYEEVELLLRFSISAHSAKGYEINFRCLKSGSAYSEIVRWNGPLGNYTYLSQKGGSQYGVADGDVVRATITGNTIRVYVNGVEVNTATDSTYSTGSPGMGFFLQGTAATSDYGFSSFEASAGSFIGIIDPSRAIDWSGAGVPGGIPARTTQCGPTIAAYSGSAAAINTAIANCPTGQFVGLGTGTFNLTTGIDFGSKDGVTVRGMGADQTFLIFTGATSCNGLGTDVAICGANSSPGAEQNVCDWTAGYAAGTTAITLGNCGSTTPARGSISNLKVGSILILDQVDEASDTGTIWNCATKFSCANTIQGGFSRTNGPPVNGVSIRSQEQAVVVTAINGNSITISPGIYMPNWRSGQMPQAFYANSYRTLDGIENLSMDHMGSSASYGVVMMNCYQCWMKGVRSLYAGRSHVELLEASHCVVRDSYFFQNQSHASISYGVEMNEAFDSLVENNIAQQITDSLPNNNGASVGNVAAYNFSINDVYGAPGWMQASFYQHAAGDAFSLWEGNIGTGYTADDVHGTHHFNTLFRNYLIGNNQSTCGGIPCNAQTIPVHLYASSRYYNIIGNVLGKAGYHNNYTCLGSAASCANGTTSIYTLGATGNSGNVDSTITGFCLDPACSSHGSYDPQTSAYLMRWGNYDTVNAAVRFVSSEVPTGISPYGNAVPGSQSLPASFYYSSKPSWWPSAKAWPSIGPDVTGGNIPGVGGHAYTIPAQDCYANVMRGPSDGTGDALTFNANTCYGQSTIAAPANLRVVR